MSRLDKVVDPDCCERIDSNSRAAESPPTGPGLDAANNGSLLHLVYLVLARFAACFVLFFCDG